MATKQKGSEKSSEALRVMVVDDHALFRRGLEMVLGAEPDLDLVGEDSDGQEAVQRAQELMPDVILMDVRMPKRSGIEATRQIRDTLPHAKILMLTISDDETASGWAVVQERWIETVALCPPTSPECMPVPLHVVRAWMSGQDSSDDGTPDLEQMAAVECCPGMRGDVDRTHPLAALWIELVEPVSRREPDMAAIEGYPSNGLDTGEGAIFANDLCCCVFHAFHPNRPAADPGVTSLSGNR